MKRLDLDFAAPSLARSVHRASLLAWVLLVLAIAVCLVAAAVGLDLRARQRASDAQLAAVRQKASAPVVVAVAVQPVTIGEPQAAAVNAATLQLNLPWRDLRDAIGAATPKQIALLALEPDARKLTMKVTAEARNSDDMIAYVEQLKQQEQFTSVNLVRHEINDQDPNRPIRFQVDAQWGAR